MQSLRFGTRTSTSTSTRTRAARTLVLAALTVLLALPVPLLAASPALAAGYRYWSYWDGAGGQWSYATQGPSTARPADGSVQGFRFAVSKDAAAEAARPRAAADFDTVCSTTPAAPGRKRVAVVVDFGVAADAPAGDAPPQDAPRTACAQLAPEATAAEALAEVAKPLRYNSAALLCAISGYPKQGCGEQITDAAPQDNDNDNGNGNGAAKSTQQPEATAEKEKKEEKEGEEEKDSPWVGPLAGLAVLSGVAGAAVWRSAQRRR
ncbi:SCO2322 family protein [Streptomyces sp. NPDC090445]|uniref:SCO2322 family protein n=1 Tax=Streptomyces sp. NPDC090445 TaxID=3365963 RepID=UPI0038103881